MGIVFEDLIIENLFEDYKALISRRKFIKAISEGDPHGHDINNDKPAKSSWFKAPSMDFLEGMIGMSVESEWTKSCNWMFCPYRIRQKFRNFDIAMLVEDTESALESRRTQ